MLMLMGTDEMRLSVAETFASEAWAGSYEVAGRIEVAKQSVVTLSNGDIEVATCERDWMDVRDVSGEPTTLRGNRGYVRSVVHVFREFDGELLEVDVGDRLDFCKGVK
jgi:hypothetical protein